MPFSSHTLRFLRALSRNNDRKWFESQREIYEKMVREPSREFIDMIREPLLKKFPMLRIDYRSIGRIHRDIRFSSDQRPYKTYLSFSFRDRVLKDDSTPGLYIGFDTTGVLLSLGTYQLEKPMREHFREKVTTEPGSTVFARAIHGAEKKGFQVGGRDLKKIPAGFDPEHPNADFLRHNGIYLSREFDFSNTFLTPKFASWTVKQFEPTLPFLNWTRELVLSGPRDPSRFFGDRK